MISRKSPTILTLLLSVFGVSYLAVANMAPNDARIIQYTGHLETGTELAQGLYDFRFALFTSAPTDATLDCLLAEPANCPLWAEEHLGSIDVQAGSFSVQLGENTDITDTILGQNQLWLGVAVRETGAAAYSKLKGSQRIVATPLASRAASAKDFKVTGEATLGTLSVVDDAVVGRDLDVDGDLRVLGIQSTQGSASVKGSLYVGSDVPGPWADGYLVVDQAAHFRCANCGSTTSFEGTDDWGSLNIHGRVLSASSFLHLSPPGGTDVVINNLYRSAGGTASGVAGLTVQGDITSGCPGGMRKIGSTCIQTTLAAGLGVDSWQSAGDRCRNLGFRMCTVSEVSHSVRLGHFASYYNFYAQDAWLWVDSASPGGGSCYVNLNNNQPSNPLAHQTCDLQPNVTHNALGTLCCK